jgi:tRNA pseudouridine55 synthase
MRGAPDDAPHGVLLVDKPAGRTSHDVVADVRRKLRTRRVGHAGTLDPGATGLLVVLVGEATKLEPYVMSSSKRYVARIVLGRATDSFDADGTTTEKAPVSAEFRAELVQRASGSRGATSLLDDALRTERERTSQVPPNVSAIQVDGKRSYARARAGEVFELPPRQVAVHALELVAIELGGDTQADPVLVVEVTASKGYYVRALARDLGQSLGVPASLQGLRRTASGDFRVEDAVVLATQPDPDELRARLVPIADVASRALSTIVLSDEQLRRVRNGLTIELVGAMAGYWAALDGDRGELVAILETDAEGRARVQRGFPARLDPAPPKPPRVPGDAEA